MLEEHVRTLPDLTEWALLPDGDPIVTPTSHLLPVTANGSPAMLKIALLDAERRGGRLMRWWDG
ncbi:aminoglycoside phosphotransferase family protein [Endosaccharibacter trunci]|uniref:aminoglycoside phosphotransferase family protein n=1 Tax=Endosaccharibacter trunci TaxID=2812733 RepID=UPI003BF52A91